MICIDIKKRDPTGFIVILQDNNKQYKYTFYNNNITDEQELLNRAKLQHELYLKQLKKVLKDGNL